eukprot:TRINITY_DN23134_c0_g1_i1.p1 TRINITY_DN23134_c0_g1~~TRINITY_DN23134_c0_g1_i1.p1  ORF type:complete len:279 (+),score=46.74 TRINITY_DN23134_c0_g1_i1:67-903(+)
MKEDGAKYQGITPLGFVAGSVAGAVGMMVGYPLDTMKVRAQVGVRRDEGGSRLVRFKRLYRGCVTPAATAGGVQCLNLGIYENCLRYSSGGKPEQAPLAHVAFAGAMGGIAISPVTCPQQRLKIHQQLLGGTIVDCAKEFYRMKGIRGFYRAFPLHVLMESFRGLYMWSYVAAKRQLSSEPDHLIPLYKRMLAGATAGTVGWMVIYPFDAIKSVLQADRAGQTRFSSSLECSKHLFTEGGILRFYRGFTYTIIRAGPVAASLLPTYDVTLQLLTRYFS